MIEFKCVQKDFLGEVETEIVLRLENDGHIHDIMQTFRRFLLAVSFAPATVDNYIEAE